VHRGPVVCNGGTIQLHLALKAKIGCRSACRGRWAWDRNLCGRRIRRKRRQACRRWFRCILSENAFNQAWLSLCVPVFLQKRRDAPDSQKQNEDKQNQNDEKFWRNSPVPSSDAATSSHTKLLILSKSSYYTLF